MNDGKIIVLEGACDGIGKSTQLNKLIERFNDLNIDFYHHHFPSYGTSHGLMVEEYLKGNYGDVSSVNPYFINSLYAVDRAAKWNKDIKKEFEKGKYILFDRYTSSSIIYQSALIENVEKRKKFINYIIDYEYNKLKIGVPNHVIFLYADYETIEKQRNKRNENSSCDIHEKDLSFLKKVYDNALFVADYLKWDKVKCDNNGKMRSVDEINDDILNIIMEEE